jgi:deoxyadenosine/deoxycytidine kinase
MYIIEGNIGAGKSTFLKLLQKQIPAVSIVLEPVQDWQKEIDGQSILANFYADPTRWAYSMELMTMIKRVEEHIKEQQHKDPLRFMERSIYSGHYCFAYNDYASGYLTELEWSIYLDWFNFLIPHTCITPKGFIYLRVSPDIAHNRIIKRSRNGESAISLEYINNIHTRHETFLIEKAHILPELASVPVLALDCNQDFESQPDLFSKHVDSLHEFIALTSSI